MGEGGHGSFIKYFAHLLWHSFCDKKHTIETLTENGPESPTRGSEELQEPQWLADWTRQTENNIDRKKKNVTSGGAPLMAPGGGQSPNVVSLAGGGGARPRPCSLPTWGTNE